MRDAGETSTLKPRRLSLELKLPLATSALLLVLLGLYTWIAYSEVASTARTAVAERDARTATELGTLTTTSSNTRARFVARTVNQPAIHRAFASGDFTGIEPALDSLRLAADSNFTVVFYDARGRPLHFVGNQPDAELMARVPSLFEPAVARDSMSVSSPFIPYRSRALFWTVAAVQRERETIGYVAQLRTVYTNPTAARTLLGLIGDGKQIVFANTDDRRSPLVRLDGTLLPALTAETPAGPGWQYQRSDSAFIGGKAEIRGTPWTLIIESPQIMADARPDQFLRRTGLLGLLLLLIAATLVWFGSRRITGPIRQLHAAARAIERGRLDERVEIERADELGELGHSFNQMAAEVQRSMHAAEESRAEAERANRTKSEFLANMSHEIRTPINAIVGYTDLIDFGVAGPVTPEQRAQLERIRVSGNHLIGLIDDLIDFARLDVARMSVQKKDVPALTSIETALTVIKPQADAKPVEIDVVCEDGTHYVGDPQRVEQILVNLLGNAVKFTEPNGSIKLECGVVRVNGERRAQFVVSDTGIGIPADRIEAIFEPFVQAKGGYTRPHGGTGLGLSISRRLAELMEGEVAVSSVVGEGSRFTLTLPLGNGDGG